MDINGSYKLYLINSELKWDSKRKAYAHEGDWGNNLYLFRTKDRAEVVKEVERLMVEFMKY